MNTHIPASKIGVIPKKNEILVPGKVYLVPPDFGVQNKSNGCFLFASDSSSHKQAKVHFSSTYPPKNIFSQSGHIDWFQTQGEHGKIYGQVYMWIEDGKFGFYDNDYFNLYDTLINSVDFDFGVLATAMRSVSKRGFMPSLFQCKNHEPPHTDRIIALENGICVIDVFSYKKEVRTYFGDSVVEICDQFIFGINKRMFWGGRIINAALNYHEKIIFALHDNSNKKEYIFEYGDVQSSNDGSPVSLFANHFYAIELPQNINTSGIAISWLRPDNHSCKCVPLTYNLEEKHGDDIRRLEDILEKLNQIGLDIDSEKETKSFLLNPKLIEPSIRLFSEQLEFYCSHTERKHDPEKRFTFTVSATYDKRYYIVAKLADVAVDIQTNEDKSVYYVTFDGSHLDEIELMFRNRMRDVHGRIIGFNTSNHPEIRFENDETFQYLHNNSFYIRLQYQITLFMQKHSIIKPESTFQRIISDIDKQSQQKFDKFHKEMMEQGRIKVKWVNEYALFRYLQKYVGDAMYQYQVAWLGSQSIDIFLPSQNIAIEYQGKQHFEAVEMFGGQEALTRTVERDKRKRQLCADNGVVLLEWPYTTSVDEETILLFIKNNAIKFVEQKPTDGYGTNINSKIEMAPALYLDSHGHKKTVKQESGEEKEKTPAYVLKQYSLRGDFIASFLSYKEAADASTVSVGQIRSAAREKQKTAGGYQWRKFSLDKSSSLNPMLESKETISPAPHIGSKARQICQISIDGNVIAEYDSIRQASNIVGVNSKSIRSVLSGTQKTAAGFYWQYKEVEQIL